MNSQDELKRMDGNDKRHSVSAGEGYPAIPIGGLRSARAVARDRGISDVSLWRWEKRGWIKTINICGKKYVELQSLAEFDERARAGEFARGPVGAAGASVKARK